MEALSVRTILRGPCLHWKAARCLLPAMLALAASIGILLQYTAVWACLSRPGFDDAMHVSHQGQLPAGASYGRRRFGAAAPEDPSSRGSRRRQRESLRESFGLIDVEDSQWKAQKSLLKKNLARQGFRGKQPKLAGHWYQDNWEPMISCPLEERVGNLGDGGKWICSPTRLTRRSRIDEEAVNASFSSEECLVYCIGSNNQWDFEEALHRFTGDDCEFHTFDPTLTRLKGKPGFVRFHPWGLADPRIFFKYMGIAANPAAKKMLNGSADASWLLRQYADGEVIDNRSRIVFPKIADFRRLLGHQHRRVTVLKIDAEGFEWIEPESSFLSEDIGQLQIELHRGTTLSRFEKNKPPAAERFFQAAKRRGLAIFHKEPNTQGCQGRCIEYSFLKLHADVWK